jgi:cbb3-type cytochrome oxidase subunit 3
MSTFQWFCLAFFVGFVCYWAYLNKKPTDSQQDQP